MTDCMLSLANEKNPETRRWVRVTTTAYIEFQVPFSKGKDGTPKVHYSPQTQLSNNPKKKLPLIRSIEPIFYFGEVRS